MTRSDTSIEAGRSSARRQVGVFLAVAYVLELAVALALPHAGIATLISIAVPAVAVAVAVLVTVRPGRRRAVWAEVGFGRPRGRALLVALIGPLVIVACSFAVAAAVGVVRFAAPGDGTGRQAAAQAVSLVAFAVVFLGEEVGWRGFLLTRLCALMPARRAVLVAGACQAAFHLPLLTLTTTYQSAGSRWIVVPVVMVTLTLAGVWYGWLRLWSGSVWPVTLSHSAFNHLMEAAAGVAVATSPAAMAYTTTETGVVTLLVVAATAAYLLIRRAADFRPHQQGRDHCTVDE